MKIAIHHKRRGFSLDWINYCDHHRIDYKVVNCYDSNIIDEIEDCDALMWHFHHADRKDVLFAKQLIYSLRTAGKVVFPDFHTSWHFDDKVGQKYLLESIRAPIVPSYVFYSKNSAIQWIGKAEFPKVFKLRTGSGSSNVQLVKDRKSARILVKRAFGNGFRQYKPIASLKERWRKYRIGLTDMKDIVKGIVRIFYTTEFDRWAENEKGYIYFQDYIPDKKFDIRIIVIAGKAIGIKRLVRKNDFRASGSGHIDYDKDNISPDILELSFKLADQLKAQSLAIDFICSDNTPLVMEVNYGFIKEVYESCNGYWDKNLKWHSGSCNPQGWMVESVLEQIACNKNVSSRYAAKISEEEDTSIFYQS